MRWLAFLLAAGLAAIAAPAQAADASAASHDIAQSFGMLCLAHPGDAPGQRHEAVQAGWQVEPDERAQRYLRGDKGVVYDAPEGRAPVLESDDNGVCYVLSGVADTGALDTEIEALLRQSGAKFVTVKDADDTATPSTHVRAYHVLIGGRIWLIDVLSDPTQPVEAMVAFAERVDADAVPQDSELTP